MSMPGSLEELRGKAQNTVGFKRLSAFFDEGSLVPIDALAQSDKTLAEVAAAYGTVEGCPVYAFAQSSDLTGGAMSAAQAQKIDKVFTMAAQNGAPVVGIYDSIGGRLQQGAALLRAYGDLLQKAAALSGVVPQISVVLGPCVGAAAMIASGADFVILSQDGQLAVAAGQERAPADAAASGEASLLVKDERAAVDAARKIVAMLPANNLDTAGFMEEQAAEACPQEGDSARTVAAAVASAGSFLELSPDFGKAACTALASVGSGATVGLVALDGELDADACVKAARFVRFCDAFSLPLISFVDAQRFVSLRSATTLGAAYAEASCAKLAVLVGQACGAVYIAVAGHGARADYTLAWPHAVVGALAPETGAVFLWGDRLEGSENPVEDRKKLIAAYADTECSPLKAAGQGLVDTVVEPADTRPLLDNVLGMLESKRVSTMPKKHSNLPF